MIRVWWQCQAEVFFVLQFSYVKTFCILDEDLYTVWVVSAKFIFYQAMNALQNFFRIFSKESDSVVGWRATDFTTEVTSITLKDFLRDNAFFDCGNQNKYVRVKIYMIPMGPRTFLGQQQA